MNSALNRTVPARILRVNHGGEHGATRIYAVQIFVGRWRCPELLPFLQEALGHEREHLARFRALMPARAAKPCRTMWVWSIGGACLGAITALMGRNAVLACTEAVEHTVHRHLNDQIRFLRDRDQELAEAISEIQIQENEHLAFARTERGGKRSSSWLIGVIGALTDALIWLSTRGDSARLERELAT